MQTRSGLLRLVTFSGVLSALSSITMTLAACAAPTTAVAITASPTAAALIDCAETTPLPEGWSILPTFEPSYPCELENVSNHVDFCMVHASPELSYPCSRDESVQETIIGEGSQTRLIQRDYHYSGGCWSGVTSDVRSLRVCDAASGESTILVENVRGTLLPSPDGLWFAFVLWEAGSYGYAHIYRVRSDGTDLIKLDTQPFPQAQAGASILRWTEDGEWLAVSLWDGTANGWYGYRLRIDGSGAFETLPPATIAPSPSMTIEVWDWQPGQGSTPPPVPTVGSTP